MPSPPQSSAPATGGDAHGAAPSSAGSPTQNLLDAVMAETVGMAMHNAVTAQNNMRMLANAAITAACARIVNTTGTPQNPPPQHLVPPPRDWGGPGGGHGDTDAGPGGGSTAEASAGHALAHPSVVDGAHDAVRQTTAAVETAAHAAQVADAREPERPTPPLPMGPRQPAVGPRT